MASSTQAPLQGPRSSFGTIPSPGNALLLDRSKMHVRRSTPDSEALASSDDDQELRHHTQSFSQTNESPLSSSRPPKPTRRPSWLNEVQSGAPRKPSFNSMASFSSNNSQPSTPAAENHLWNSTITPVSSSGAARNQAGGTFGNWGTGIWNTDSTRKELPSRLSEVLPSPTSIIPPHPYGESDITSSTARELSGDSTIPFPIPLHPTLKTYRSQSYSVGQLDAESATGSAAINPYLGGGRIRPGQSSGLQHRPSRPSMLSEVSGDGNGLGQLQEIEDDDESNGSSTHGVNVTSAEARTIEYLARENAMLRQAALENQESQRRGRAGTAIQSGHVGILQGYPPHSQGVLEATGEEGSEYAVDGDELHELQGFGRQAFPPRRFSEFTTDRDGRLVSLGMPVNSKLESIKRGQWQSSLGFTGLEEIPQSRRHSFAETDSRNPSTSSSASAAAIPQGFPINPAISSKQDHTSAYGNGSERRMPQDHSEYDHFLSQQNPALVQEQIKNIYHRRFAAAYSAGEVAGNRIKNGPEYGPQGVHRMNGAYAGIPQSRPNQVLYVVTFKCCRADIFYISEGTGLHVKPGDLVVVEADRGTDLGTVAVADVPWQKAKDLKEQYSDEHYKWLMMFSQSNQNAISNGIDPVANSPTGNVSAIGGMGPQGGQNGMQEPASGELKPKMIKRLAQQHEIQSLRDKEGNEARAKRVCQQKVVEHGLQMEILDAEFQMDWKKLTFYYFADAYINFNSLVTDLFKIYKTRIWMSAVNLQAHSGPTPGLQPPSGIGPGALGTNQDRAFENRRQDETPPVYGGIAHHYSALQPPQDSRSNGASYQSSPVPQNGFGYGYQQFGQIPRQPAFGMGGYQPAMAPPQSTGSPFGVSAFAGTNGNNMTAYPNPGLVQGNGQSNFRGPHEGLVENFQNMALGPR